MDGSEFGTSVLPAAVGIAESTDAELRLVEVHVPIPNILSKPPGEEDVRRERESGYLRAFSKMLRRGGARVSSTLAEGKVPDAILREAESWGADLIVMATHGKGPIARLWMGSVAEEVVRRSPLPVLLVRPSAEAASAQEKWHDFRRVLIPLDGSAFAETVVESAISVAGPGAEFELLRLVAPAAIVGDSSLFPGEYSMIVGATFDQEKDRAREYLDGVCEKITGRGLRVHATVMVSTDPARAICDIVSAHSADLVAMATHGRKGLGRLLMGSVAAEVVRSVGVPVLLKKPAADEDAPGKIDVVFTRKSSPAAEPVAKGSHEAIDLRAPPI